MKIIVFTILMTMFLCVFTTCNMLDNSIPIHGTVILTRNDIPWDIGFFPMYNYSRGIPPPPISIVAFTENGERVGGSPVSLRKNNDEYSMGTHQWSFNIPGSMLPGYFNFRVSAWMSDVAFGLADIMTENFWIQDGTTVVGIGTINYNVIRLYGNLPITINNEQFIGGRSMFLTLLPTGNVNFFPTYSTGIDSNGDWSFNIDQRYLDTFIEFSLDVRKNFDNHNRLWKNLNPYTLTISDNGIEVVFPNFLNGVDF